jgi:hypothetical protein
VRRETSVRYAGCRQDLAVVKRRFVERVGLCLRSLLPRRVHAVTLDGFMLKLMCFIYARNFNLLHKVASRVNRQCAPLRAHRSIRLSTAHGELAGRRRIGGHKKGLTPEDIQACLPFAAETRE